MKKRSSSQSQTNHSFAATKSAAVPLTVDHQTHNPKPIIRSLQRRREAEREPEFHAHNPKPIIRSLQLPRWQPSILPPIQLTIPNQSFVRCNYATRGGVWRTYPLTIPNQSFVRCNRVIVRGSITQASLTIPNQSFVRCNLRPAIRAPSFSRHLTIPNQSFVRCNHHKGYYISVLRNSQSQTNHSFAATRRKAACSDTCPPHNPKPIIRSLQQATSARRRRPPVPLTIPNQSFVRCNLPKRSRNLSGTWPLTIPNQSFVRCNSVAISPFATTGQRHTCESPLPIGTSSNLPCKSQLRKLLLRRKF